MSNSSWDEERTTHSPSASEDISLEAEITVNPLALMNESSPEAWLGQFLIELDMASASRRSTIALAREDLALLDRLLEARASVEEDVPLDLFDAAHAERVRAEDWAAWWSAQERLSKYCYSTLALALLGNQQYGQDVAAMYSQTANKRIRKDAHFVICYLLGKHWLSYEPTESDLQRLG